jgi:predicted nucleic acid-binding Zn ribbon protein
VSASGGQHRSTTRDLPRRLGEVLKSSVARIEAGDEARAYAAWARAAGTAVTAGTRPHSFRRGRLTVLCASSVWAQELTYLGPQILRRMDQLAPGHPVKRFRFVVGRLASGDADVSSARDPGAGRT